MARDDRYYDDAPPIKRKSGFWTLASKPGAWLFVLLVSGLGGAIEGAITGYFQPSVEEQVAAVMEHNTPPVEVSHRELAAISRMWLPAGGLSASQMSELDDLTMAQQAERIIDMGGFAYGGRDVEVELRGVRTETVRILDITHNSKCTPVEQGSMIALQGEDAAGAGSPITQLKLNVEKPGESTQEVKSGADSETGVRSEAYLDNTRLTVDKGEEVVLRIHMTATSELCDTSLQLVVEDGDGETTLDVFEGQRVEVGPNLDRPTASPSNAYLGSGMCGTFTEVDPALMTSIVGQASCDPDAQPPVPRGAVPAEDPSPSGSATPSPSESRSPVGAGATEAPSPSPTPTDELSELFTPIPTEPDSQISIDGR